MQDLIIVLVLRSTCCIGCYAWGDASVYAALRTAPGRRPSERLVSGAWKPDRPETRPNRAAERGGATVPGGGLTTQGPRRSTPRRTASAIPGAKMRQRARDLHGTDERQHAERELAAVGVDGPALRRWWARRAIGVHGYLARSRVRRA